MRGIKPRTGLALGVLALVCPSAVFAAGVSVYSPPTGFSHYFSLGLKGLYGRNSSADSATVSPRSMDVFGFDGVFGTRWYGVIIGGGLEYDFWRQWTDPSNLAGSNTQGKMFSAGPVLGYSFKTIKLMGKYNLYSRYTADQLTSSGQKLAYFSPNSYALQVQFQHSRHWYWGAEYTHTEYKRYSLNGYANTLASGSKAEFGAFGLIFGTVF